MWPQQRSSFSAVWDVTRRYDATAREPLRRFCSSVECDGDPGAQQDSRCSSVAIMSTTPNRTPPHRTKAVASAEAPCYWRRAGLLASWRELSGIASARYSPVCFCSCRTGGSLADRVVWRGLKRLSLLACSTPPLL